MSHVQNPCEANTDPSEVIFYPTDRSANSVKCSNFHISKSKNNHGQLQLHILPEIYIECIYMYFRVSFLDMNIDITLINIDQHCRHAITL